MPEHPRSDNGPEFIAYCIQDWLKGPGDQDALHQAGKPLGKGHIESFHDKLRDECLNRKLFGNLQEARVILESWRVEYNERRPHSSLRYQTPTRCLQEDEPVDGGCAPPNPRCSPRQAFGGNSEATPQGGQQTKTKTLRNLQSFSYEVSHLRGHASFF